ncbi:MAG: class II fructose-bisphosphate aldolase [bacterium]
MKFLPMSELMVDAQRGGYAVPAFPCWSTEIASIVLRTAQEMGSPVILMGAPVDLDEIPPEEYGALLAAVAARYNVPAALHLDHGDTPERVERCMASGFTSVMLDFSTRPYAENVAALRAIVDIAHPLGITVEGELGAVGKVDTVTQEGAGHSALTDPEEAVRYVVETGIDALAVAIGNAHGNYTVLPQLDFALLERIAASTPVPLVLHGGSGTPLPDLLRSIALGIVKVNVASELIRAYRESVMEQWSGGRNLWVPTALGEAGRALVPILQRWMTQVGSVGRV